VILHKIDDHSVHYGKQAQPAGRGPVTTKRKGTPADSGSRAVFSPTIVHNPGALPSSARLRSLPHASAGLPDIAPFATSAPRTVPVRTSIRHSLVLGACAGDSMCVHRREKVSASSETPLCSLAAFNASINPRTSSRTGSYLRLHPRPSYPHRNVLKWWLR
jgi:hypothetical protein